MGHCNEKSTWRLSSKRKVLSKRVFGSKPWGRWCHGTQNLFKGLLGIALECNRDEWMPWMPAWARAHASRGRQSSSSSARFPPTLRANVFGRSAALRRLPIAELRTPRLGSRAPEHTATPKDLEQVLTRPHAQQVVVRARQGNHRRIGFAHALAQLEQRPCPCQTAAGAAPAHAPCSPPRRSCRCGARA